MNNIFFYKLKDKDKQMMKFEFDIDNHNDSRYFRGLIMTDLID